MKSSLAAIVLAVSLSSLAQSPAKDSPAGTTYEPNIPALNNNYPLTPDSLPQPGVPQGSVFKFNMDDSRVYPNTHRVITVYVPAQYTPSKPAALWIKLDAFQPSLTTTLDNLIAKHEIPVMIAIGISAGQVASAHGQEGHRLQRSYEFDGQSDRLARFLMEEVIPALEAHKTPSGDDIHISADPNDHGISGGSTGGIGAFTAAFLRPDYFRRVFAYIGTFVGMRGGEQEYVQVRKSEPRPLRIFMVDGANDEWPGGPEMGDWHMSNLTLERALEFAGYDVKHVWGQGAHNGNQADQLFPEVLRWLWRDYPQPITAKAPGNPRLAEIVLPNETWQPATSGPIPTAAIGPEGKLYVVLPGGGFNINTSDKKASAAIAANLHIRGITVRSNGDVYAVAETSNLNNAEIWRITPDGKETKLDDNVRGATCLAFTPDGLWLLVGQSNAQHILDYRVAADGTIDAREAMYQVYAPITADDAGIGQLAFDNKGLLYAATSMGVQIFDRNGRVIAILPLPANEAITGLTFGDADFHTIYVSTVSGKIYKRKLKVTGYPSNAPPIQLPPPTSALRSPIFPVRSLSCVG